MTASWWLALLCMGGVTFLLRAAPLFLPKGWLKSQLLTDLNAALPLSVMTLLLLASLHLDSFPQHTARLGAEVGAILCVLLAHIRWRNVLFSMIVGVGVLNGLLWLFQAA